MLFHFLFHLWCCGWRYGCFYIGARCCFCCGWYASCFCYGGWCGWCACCRSACCWNTRRWCARRWCRGRCGGRCWFRWSCWSLICTCECGAQSHCGSDECQCNLFHDGISFKCHVNFSELLRFVLLAVLLRTASTWSSFFVLTGFCGIFLELLFEKFLLNGVNRFAFKPLNNLNFFLLKSPFDRHISESADAQRGLPNSLIA